MTEHDDPKTNAPPTPDGASPHDPAGDIYDPERAGVSARGEGATLLRVDYANVTGFLNDFRRNICHGEMVIRSSRRLERDQVLHLMISFPGLLTPLHLVGKVAWLRRDGGPELAYGIEIFQDGGDWSQLPALIDGIVAGDSSLVAVAVQHVLIAEDNPHVADLVRRGLEAHVQRTGQDIAFEIRHAENGLIALQLLHSEPYDLLILDIFLPVMDGIEVIEKVRADPDLEPLPIIALSAADEVEESALAAGADFFLAKPLRLTTLLRTMDRLALAVSGVRDDAKKDDGDRDDGAGA